jgi:outer membrane cobalamin receptor
MSRIRSHLLLAGVSALVPAIAVAQTPPSDPAVVPPPVAKPAGEAKVYTPADFARFAPKNAYDMLVQLPGFTIRSADQERGLGQASENVLINGQRVANKSGGAIDLLQRTPIANVSRVEIVEAASLWIAGLTGQVANVLLKEGAKSSGQFEWNPNFRAHYAKPELFGGSISYSGKTGPVDYTLSLKNDYGRGALGGPISIYDGAGTLTETRHEVFHSEFEQANMQAKFGLDGPGSSVGNLTLGYTPYWNPVHIRDRRTFADGEIRRRTNVQKLDGYYADISGDYEFAFGPGRLKLIGVRHWEHEPLVQTQIMHFESSGAPDEGTRFSRDTHLGETIGRGEYHWKTGKNDWQVTFERAFNSLDQKGDLFELNPGGQFEPVEYPEGTGKVTEVRYEGIATLSRPISGKVDLQIAAGAEISQLDRVDDDKPARKFFRPKGSLTLGWHPDKSWDISLKLRRRVGQISFYDFLAQPQLSDDRENAGNPDLVPPQSWEVETEFSHDLGAWGKTQLNLHYYRVEDIVDVIPIGEDKEGIGNLPKATQLGFESTSTINLDPIGWVGAKVDATFGGELTSVRDPLTHEKRPITGQKDRWASLSIRHDIPHTQIAWSAYVQHRHYAKNYYLTEVFRELDLPWISGFYVEDKNVFGTTVRLSVDNIFNNKHTLNRVVYTGYRDRSPISYIQLNNEVVGPIFNLSVKGSF